MMQPRLSANDKSILLLIFMYVAIVLAISLRCYVEATNYTSPDSKFYLRVASNLLEGKGLVAPHIKIFPFDENTPESYLAAWPVGYPVAVAMIKLLGGVNFLAASKIVNLLFLGGIFILLYQWFGAKAWFPALYFFSYAKMEVFSYSWSEGGFLFFLLLLCYYLSNLEKPYIVAKMTFCLTMMFFFRYVGILYFGFVGLYMLYLWSKREYTNARKLLVSLIFASIPCIIYLLNNKIQTGYFTGVSRINPEEMSNWFAVSASLIGFVNEFLFARNYFILKSSLEWIFIGFLVLEILLGCYLWKMRIYLQGTFLDNTAAILMISGFFYLVFSAVLYRMQACSHFDYRILAPFSTTFFIGVFYALTRHEAYFNKTWKWITGFMVVCFLMNLPKVYLLSLIF